MFDWLKEHGMDDSKLIKEDKSLSTKQNALYSVPIAASIGATEILLCTTPEHMNRKFLNPKKLFKAQLKKYPSIKLSTCCCVEDLKDIK